MNKHEAIKKVEQMGEYERFVDESIPKLSVLNILNQLDEPQKPVVPQFVVEKIKYFKKTGDWDLFQAMDYSFGEKEIREWLENKNNQETFARAWLDGYTVEEKRYLVKLKGVTNQTRTLKRNIDVETWYFGNPTNYEDVNAHHTREELESNGFGWVFDCEGVEVEEVEE
jgi:hypothetical protein